MTDSPCPLFSIVVPLFRAEETLRRAAESLIAQTEGRWEALLVDDGSPDGSGRLAHRLAGEDSRFRALSHPTNRGTHEARRTGVAAARGKWVLFLDSDDELSAGLLARLRDRLVREPVDLLRFDFTWRNPMAVDEAIRRFHDSGRCSGRSASGVGCVLRMFFTGSNVPMLLPAFVCKASVCKTAFEKTEASRLVYAEDIYEFFALASFAESYGEEPFPGYVYDAGTGGITRWRSEIDRDPEAYVAGYFANLEARLASFAAMARFAKSFSGCASRAVRRAMRRERRRVLAGGIPWEFSVLEGMGVTRQEALRRGRPACAQLSRMDRFVLRLMLLLRFLFDRLVGPLRQGRKSKARSLASGRRRVPRGRRRGAGDAV